MITVCRQEADGSGRDLTQVKVLIRRAYVFYSKHVTVWMVVTRMRERKREKVIRNKGLGSNGTWHFTPFST